MNGAIRNGSLKSMRRMKMSEYTYKDVIIDPEDPRVEIGKEYYSSNNIIVALFKANEGNETFCYRLISVQEGDYGPFRMDKEEPSCFDFLIRKKEPEKRYVPFDLSLPEDREKLRGAWVRMKTFLEREEPILCITERAVYVSFERAGISPEVLLSLYEFVDGTPCGKLVEVNND